MDDSSHPGLPRGRLAKCRLQGYGDGHTATSNGQPQADGPQYKQHGNGIAVPMFAWVAKRIAAVDAAIESEATA